MLPGWQPGPEGAQNATTPACRAEKESLAAQNSQTWQLLEERTSEIHRLQVCLILCIMAREALGRCFAHWPCLTCLLDKRCCGHNPLAPQELGLV